jgi:DUF917 family protein
MGLSTMRELTEKDAAAAVAGGGVLACGGGGWKHHGQVMGRMATTMSRPVLVSVDELPASSWAATVTAIGAPASPSWEIRPVDYVDALRALMDAVDVDIRAVMTAQNGYSTTLNGWIQSSVLDVKVLDAAGDVRAHPTGKLGSLGLAQRPGYVSTQVVSGGNRGLHGHFLSVNRGDVNTCDDVLRDISVRTGGFIASARNPVELAWVKEHAALGAISLALDLGAAMIEAGTGTAGSGDAVVEVVAERLGATVLDTGPLRLAQPTRTMGGWDHGAFRVGGHTVPYLNEYMVVDCGGARVATYPDTISIIDRATGEALAVKDGREGMEVVLLTVPASALPVSRSAIDRAGLEECERIMGVDLVRHLDTSLTGGSRAYVSAAH